MRNHRTVDLDELRTGELMLELGKLELENFANLEIPENLKSKEMKS